MRGNTIHKIWESVWFDEVLFHISLTHSSQQRKLTLHPVLAILAVLKKVSIKEWIQGQPLLHAFIIICMIFADRPGYN